MCIPHTLKGPHYNHYILPAFHQLSFRFGGAHDEFHRLLTALRGREMKQQLALAAQDAYGSQQQVPGLPPTWEVQVVCHGSPWDPGSPSYFYRKIVGKSWENHGKTIGKSWGNDGKIIGT